MRIGRRGFIQGTAWIAAAPAFAGLVAFSLVEQSPASAPPRPSEPRALGGGTDRNCVIFKIEGWDRCDDRAGDQVLIRINQSWKTAWR